MKEKEINPRYKGSLENLEYAVRRLIQERKKIQAIGIVAYPLDEAGDVIAYKAFSLEEDDVEPRA